ncbi:hypothetical protein FH972_012437 [Carpinus fangiana]|uniref:Uncharacterized protein n=1 Tax=Carpinus fangiana TaxID=176857 RepID=A0A5N6R6Y7_9ROSI|nr:hypothetical protein FH972_012437 [Carpinus fangiana]
MANDWSTLFDKVLSDKDLKDRCIKRVITWDDIRSKEIRLSQMDVKPFYNICIEELQQAINDGSSISVQIFSPGEMVSVGTNIRFKKGLQVATLNTAMFTLTLPTTLQFARMLLNLKS